MPPKGRAKPKGAGKGGGDAMTMAGYGNLPDDYSK